MILHLPSPPYIFFDLAMQLLLVFAQSKLQNLSSTRYYQTAKYPHYFADICILIIMENLFMHISHFRPIVFKIVMFWSDRSDQVNVFQMHLFTLYQHFFADRVRDGADLNSMLQFIRKCLWEKQEKPALHSLSKCLVSFNW